MYITGIGTATPDTRYGKAECLAAFERSDWFARLDARSHLIARTVLRRENGIETRHLAMESIDDVFAYGITNDALHITQPSLDGQVRTMRAALHSAKLMPEAIDAINAHGTGTKANDSTETAAIRAVFGSRAERVPISATKAIHGHLLGATGALETLLSLLAMRHDTLLPTVYLTTADPECDLDYVSERMRADSGVHTMLMNSFAFGGSNAVLVLRAAA